MRVADGYMIIESTEIYNIPTLTEMPIRYLKFASSLPITSGFLDSDYIRRHHLTRSRIDWVEYIPELPVPSYDKENYDDITRINCLSLTGADIRHILDHPDISLKADRFIILSGYIVDDFNIGSISYNVNIVVLREILHWYVINSDVDCFMKMFNFRMVHYPEESVKKNNRHIRKTLEALSHILEIARYYLPPYEVHIGSTRDIIDDLSQ